MTIECLKKRGRIAEKEINYLQTSGKGGDLGKL